MKDFVAYIVKNLVDHPEKVKINEIGGTQTLIIELSVEKSDIGKIIGKRGKTINAIRNLLMSVASRNGLRVNLEIIEEGEEGTSKAAQAHKQSLEQAEAAQEEEKVEVSSSAE